MHKLDAHCAHWVLKYSLLVYCYAVTLQAVAPFDSRTVPPSARNAL